ncbi:MAG: ATP-binding protein [bacterium]|nr:ATP-binding protein [bacterium]
MLIRFTVSNYLSFNEEVEFSMIPGKSRSHPNHLIKSGKRGSIGVLKAGVIYGANASGKSNLVKAVSFARNLIVNGTRPKKNIPRSHFKLDGSCANKPSRFEFEFKLKEKAYAYGFELDTRKIYHEWLYEITKTSQKMIFERKLADADKSLLELGKIQFKDKYEKQLVKLMKTRENQLFLTQSIEAGVKQFDPVMNWFRKMLIIFPDSYPQGGEFTFGKNQQVHETLVKLLKHFDTGISDIQMVPTDLKNDLGIFPGELDSLLAEKLEGGERAIIKAPNNNRYLVTMNRDNRFELFKLMTTHKQSDSDETVLMEMDDESDGTRRLLDLTPALHLVFNEDRVCMIDELDRSLHPKLCSKILGLFFDNPVSRESQLIVTTHESGLLNLNSLRRDEIWFVGKNSNGASTVYSLEEFVPRYDVDIRKGYLMGRFGGVPVMSEVS